MEEQDNIQSSQTDKKIVTNIGSLELIIYLKAFTSALMFSFYFSSSTVGGVTLNKREKKCFRTIK